MHTRKRTPAHAPVRTFTHSHVCTCTHTRARTHAHTYTPTHSCAPDEPETIAERALTKAEIGDFLVVEGAGAYCSAMSTKNYNCFPEAPEILYTEDGKLHVIRKRQPVEEIWKNEVVVDDAVLSAGAGH